MTRIKMIITLAVMLMFLTQPAYAESITYTTTEPTEGTEVVAYQWAVSMDDGDFVDVPELTTLPELTLEFDDNHRYRVIVRGVDAAGVYGKEWSLPSDELYNGSPSMCSKPVKVASK